MSASAQADAAQARLVAAAREFARYKPRRNPSAAYAVALNDLLTAGRAWSIKSDEEWAAEVAELKEIIRRCDESMRDGAVSCSDDFGARIAAALEEPSP